MTYSYNIAYSPTGEILQFRYEENQIYNARVANGERVIQLPDSIDYRMFKVDVATKTLINKTSEELAQENISPIEIPDMHLLTQEQLK